MDGNLLRLGETREIAIYRRGGLAWVADFRSGRGELCTPGVWFALNAPCSALRAGLGGLEPLPAEVIGRIEALHAAAERSPLADAVAKLAKQTKQICASAEVFLMRPSDSLSGCANPRE
jgi:hypothetical protein